MIVSTDSPDDIHLTLIRTDQNNDIHFFDLYHQNNNFSFSISAEDSNVLLVNSNYGDIESVEINFLLFPLII